MSSGPAAPGAKALVLDANILVRAALGRRVLSILQAYAGSVQFLAPEVAFIDVRTHLPKILTRRGLPASDALQLVESEILGRLPMLVTPVPEEVYADLEKEAKRRLSGRDEEDWPFLALAMRMDCPIWTEDQDFFGSGVATWTTNRIEIYLASNQ